MERQIKLIWDFRGPTSQKTAAHHEIHLREFIKNNDIKEYTITGMEELHEMHSLAYWVIPESRIPVYRDVLKPHRASVYTAE
ncbi:hypothetical protein FHG64_14090 [Antarcticibacterium flavum]|uniref:Uncharacterized protein n=1 Tax=Antarcticibacterium flavum TaxID=2058175 RepID=A0A5B7X8P7_9FLAO|nr:MULTISPECIES: hypothetical protein [Antarcticibacterium]MCM4159961.1 hypothetical protein [Antarcticibacterium sp. W02-3]QCY71450.1 hypothetical protein FHG64_14090 [Antarcticibacterium flavum]